MPPQYGPPVLASVTRSAAELTAELRREFERVLLERYGQLPEQDPVLATLFHATAVQLARVYEEAEQVFPEAVFDDLVSGLGMPARLAEPSQTVVGFTGVTRAEVVTPDVALTGINRRGEHMKFAVDLPVRIGPTTLRFAGVVEAGRLHALPGATLPEVGGATPQPFPVGVVVLDVEAAQMAPTLFLAFDVGPAHLGGLGVLLDAQTGDHAVARALARSAWQLLDESAAGGVARERLVLRSQAGPGGARLLRWQYGDGAPVDDLGVQRPPAAARGPYGPLCFMFPEVPADRQVRSRTPHAIAGALARLAPATYERAYDRPLVWVQVPLPAGTRGAAAALQRVVVNCAPASNVQVHAERVDLSQLGAVVAFRPEGARGRHLLAVLGVTGEQGDRYVTESDLNAGLQRGRYRERNGTLEFRPARGPTGRFDTYVMVRLLYTDGERANGLQTGEVAGRGTRFGTPGVLVANLVPSRGGSGPPPYAPAKVRFAELLRTRERVVSAADFDVVARAFDPRVLGASVATGAELDEARVPRRVETVTVRVRHGDFTDEASELPRFTALLERYLQARAVLGSVIRVRVEPERRSEIRLATRAGNA